MIPKGSSHTSVQNPTYELQKNKNKFPPSLLVVGIRK
jgi:hypothetical protein